MPTVETDDGYHLHEAAHVGRVALRVEAFEHVLPFYRDVVGLSVGHDEVAAQLGPADGPPALVLTEDPDVPSRPPEASGLFHVAIRVPDRAALADVCARIRERPWAFTGASNHLVSEALYMRDPAGNGVEVYRDRDRTAWPETEDSFVGMDTQRLDLDDLQADARGAELVPAGTDIGHVHLEVTDLPRAESFYAGTLGLRIRDRYGDQATFLAAGDYHHHVAVNTWNGCTESAGETQGLDWFELVVPDEETLGTLRARLHAHDRPVEERDGYAATTDPDEIRLRLRVER